jgi:hypothetical protein
LVFPIITNLNSSNISRSTSTCFSLGHVRFAPLPSPDPNRRRSKLPLGVAGRSRRRRPVREGRQLEQGRSLWTNDPAADPLLEDPLVTLGKFVKSTTKHLWRRLRDRNGLVDQVEPIQHDVVLDIRPMDGQEQLVEITPRHRQVVVSENGSAERPALDIIDNNLKWRWRRSTGSTMPSGPGLH